MAITIEGFKDHRPATEQDIIHFQMALGAVLPDDYREFLLKYNGGYPEPSGFRGGKEVLNSLFGFCQKHHCLLCNFYIHRTILPQAIIPIADDPFGNLVCLGVAAADGGRVFFWDHEYGDSSGLSHVADSFTNFLDSLCMVPER
jgi:hypothetical protein